MRKDREKVREEVVETNKLELKDTVVAIKRVSKTVKGGRTMRFSALVVVGDGDGHVGVGHGKSAEIPEAIRKGKEAATRNMVEIRRDNGRAVPALNGDELIVQAIGLHFLAVQFRCKPDFQGMRPVSLGRNIVGELTGDQLTQAQVMKTIAGGEK